MKLEFTLLLLGLFLSTASSAYDWLPHGPLDIKAINICFVYDSQGIVCTDDGMYIYQDDMEWHYYNYGALPVIDVVYYTPEKLLLVMGDGTWSDGIYTFDLQTNLFEVVEWMYKPVFLRYDEFNSEFYAGGEQEGLLKSADGVNWNNVDFFNSIVCYDAAFYDGHIAVSVEGELGNNFFLSSDGGSTWQNSVNAIGYTEIEYNGSGDLFAIGPNLASSSGIYVSLDYGNYWEVVNFEWNMSSLACDPFGNVLVGWENGNGIARVDPSIWDPPFVYLNEGLPDTYVHSVKVNPAMSAPNVFVCTDSGVYYSHDYLTGIDEKSMINPFGLYPNPVFSNQSITIIPPDPMDCFDFSILDQTGKIVRRMTVDAGFRMIYLNGILPGCYICFLEQNDQQYLKKLVIY